MGKQSYVEHQLVLSSSTEYDVLTTYKSFCLCSAYNKHFCVVPSADVSETPSQEKLILSQTFLMFSSERCSIDIKIWSPVPPRCIWPALLVSKLLLILIFCRKIAHRARCTMKPYHLISVILQTWLSARNCFCAPMFWVVSNIFFSFRSMKHWNWWSGMEERMPSLISNTWFPLMNQLF